MTLKKTIAAAVTAVVMAAAASSALAADKVRIATEGALPGQSEEPDRADDPDDDRQALAAAAQRLRQLRRAQRDRDAARALRTAVRGELTDPAHRSSP